MNRMRYLTVMLVSMVMLAGLSIPAIADDRGEGPLIADQPKQIRIDAPVQAESFS